MSNPTPRLHVIEGDLPPEREWTEAEIRRTYTPAIKALPFVKLQKDAEPGWHPESYWNVFQTRSRDQDITRGEHYAVVAMTAMRSDGRNVLADIFRDMIAAGVKREMEAREKKRRRPKLDLVMSGFLDQLAKMFEPRDGGEFVTDIEDAIDTAEGLMVTARQLACPKDIRDYLKYHIKKLQEFRTRLSSAKPSVTPLSLKV